MADSDTTHGHTDLYTHRECSRMILNTVYSNTYNPFADDGSCYRQAREEKAWK